MYGQKISCFLLLNIPKIEYVEARYSFEKPNSHPAEPKDPNSPVSYYAVYHNYIPKEVYFLN